MEFERSTHAKSWMFSRASLAACRDDAVSIDSGFEEIPGRRRVRKFASGFHRRRVSKATQKTSVELRASPVTILPSSLSPEIQKNSLENEFTSPLSMVSSTEQEILVQFHAHQISLLVGPHAILPELRRSNNVLATAIMIFRRFYLSNSILQFKPRALASASALLAAKIEESKINIRYLEQATKVVAEKVRSAPLLFRKELESVSIEEIEVSERYLLEGLNYECRCFHPFGAVKALSLDIARTFSNNDHCDHEERDTTETVRGGAHSPISVSFESIEEVSRKVYVKAMDIVQKALLFSDVPFLFSPGKIAFAAIRIAQREADSARFSRVTMEDYLRIRFPGRSNQELMCFGDDVSQIICMLEDNKTMGVGPQGERTRRSTGKKQPTLASHADELRKVLEKVNHPRHRIGGENVETNHQQEKVKKRKFGLRCTSNDCPDNTTPCHFKIPKVTPNSAVYLA